MNLLSVAGMTLMACVSQAGDWPQFQYDAVRGGVNASEIVGQLETAFEIDVLGAGTDTQLNLAGPVTLGDTVYIGTNNGWVSAVGRKSGTAIWQTYTDGAIRASPAIAEGTLLLPSTDGFLSACVVITKLFPV